MKKYIWVFTAALLSASVCNAETCNDKIQSIENEIVYAKQHNNTNRLRGLNKALKETKDNCTDEKLEKKQDKNIKDKQEGVDKAQKELDKTIAEGKSPEKINKKRKKLEKKKKELQEELYK